MDASLELGLLAQREVAELLAERLAECDDERAMSLLNSLLDIQVQVLKEVCRSWQEYSEKRKENAATPRK